MVICCGTQLQECVHASEKLRGEGLDIGVVNARFVKPMDRELIRRAAEELPFIITVEEAALMTGFGSAVLETISDLGLSAKVRRLGLPDDFIEHGERGELLADLELDSLGVAKACREMASQTMNQGSF